HRNPDYPSGHRGADDRCTLLLLARSRQEILGMDRIVDSAGGHEESLTLVVEIGGLDRFLPAMSQGRAVVSKRIQAFALVVDDLDRNRPAIDDQRVKLLARRPGQRPAAGGGPWRAGMLADRRALEPA